MQWSLQHHTNAGPVLPLIEVRPAFQRNVVLTLTRRTAWVGFHYSLDILGLLSVRQVLCHDHDQVLVLCHDRGDGELCRGACVVARCSCGGPTPANQALTDMTRQVV